MGFTGVAGLGGIGFVLVAVALNVTLARAKVPLPASGASLASSAAAFAAAGRSLRVSSLAAPLSWLCLTVFAAGLLMSTWREDAAGWALVGFAGVLMQNVTFTGVEALRFGMASAARQGQAQFAGFWSLANVLFCFNQVFLATALLGFTAAGQGAALVPVWQAVLGYGSAVLLTAAATAAPFNADGGKHLSRAGLVGWLGWVGWIVAYSITLLGR